MKLGILRKAFSTLHLLITLTVASPVWAQDYCGVIFRSEHTIEKTPIRSPKGLVAVFEQRVRYQHEIEVYHLMDNAVPPPAAEAPIYLNYLNRFHMKTDDYTKSYADFPTLPFFHDLNFSEIKRIESDSKFRHDFAKQLHSKTFEKPISDEFEKRGFGYRVTEQSKTVEGIDKHLLSAARMILATKRAIDSNRRQGFTKKDFRELARIENLKIEKTDKVFRYDSRSPEEILQQGGFKPNPEKPIGSISLHSTQISKGSRFVSLSIEAGNKYSLESAGITKFGRELKGADTDLIFQRLVSEAETKEKTIENYFVSKPKLVVVYEYMVESIEGVAPPAENAIAGEQEFIVPYVPNEKITAYRPVYILSAKVEKGWNLKRDAPAEVEFGDWVIFP